MDTLPLSELVNHVHCMDCFELLKQIPDKTVDAYITDLPYGTTACSWDEVIPFEPMWAEVKRTLKPRGVFVTTASQPFTSKLVMSNVSMFGYCLVWEKDRPTGFFHAKDKPLTAHEDIAVFYGSYGSYNPQGLIPIKPVNNGRKNKKGKIHDGGTPKGYSMQTIGNYPRSVLRFPVQQNGDHPTQKPIALYEYLIRTYTQPDNLVVDFCSGSGTTALAARNLNRNFIVGDQSEDYCAIARKRLAQPFTPLFPLFLEPEAQETVEAQ